MLFDIVVPGQVVALRTPAEERESFYLAVVCEVNIAVTDTFDAYRHFVLKGGGGEYFSCNYLGIVKHHKKFVQYKKLTAKVIVHPYTFITICQHKWRLQTFTWREAMVMWLFTLYVIGSKQFHKQFLVSIDVQYVWFYWFLSTSLAGPFCLKLHVSLFLLFGPLTLCWQSNVD